LKYEVWLDIDDVAADGSLNVLCRECWNDHHGAFKSESNWRSHCRNAWLRRAFQNDEHHDTLVRCQAWDPLGGTLDEHRPDATPRLYREQLIRKSTRLAVGIAAETASMQANYLIRLVKQIERMTDEWTDDTDDRCSDREIESEGELTQHFMVFLNTVWKGSDEYYMCRLKHCSMLSLSKYWIHNKPNHQYRCPACGEEYRPGQDFPTYWRTNRVFVVHDLVGLRTERADSEEVMILPVMDSHAHHNQVMILPVMWPEDTDIDCIKSIVRDLEDEFLDEKKRHQYGLLLGYLSFSAPPQIFERLHFLPPIKAAIDHLNSLQPYNHRSVWQYDHIERDGYMGIKIGPEHDMDEPMSRDDFIRTWFLSMWLTEAASFRDLVATRQSQPAAASST
jgi:hypothetical protein